jgi:hypothetical protein
MHEESAFKGGEGKLLVCCPWRQRSRKNTRKWSLRSQYLDGSFSAPSPQRKGNSGWNVLKAKCQSGVTFLFVYFNIW